MKKAKEIEKGKQTAETKRNNLLSYIRSLKSRQEFHPLVGNYIDKMKCEPLHLKNNTCKELFMVVLKVTISEAKLSKIKKFAEVPENNIFQDFLNFVHYNMGCNYLKKK